MPGSPMPEHSVAIVGMACLYPDARSPAELWENILAQRRAFRRFPRERLDLADYYSPDRAAPDRTYGQEAALIEGYQFDRVRFRVGGSAYRAADLTHWLALDIAERALADAGFPEGRGLPREATGVLLGNTLTGEFSRASVMRLRWPFVRRVAEAALAGVELAPPERRRFLETLGERFKEPFAPIGEDSLAGGLANTIAGRICNYFDFKGGGYTVDGACSSSLLAVANGCSALVAGDLDVAIVGGVDLSLDPFELVGFAKAGALSAEDMRIYDRRPAGFLPGEGCGIVVLMRLADAVAQGRRIWATVRGWGISSDGHGGLTRPEVEGQLLALRRAYRHTGFGPEAVGYFEGHGTGTAVGDACELQVLSRARREADPTARPAAVGSIKATIGHTKAAAGVAGLIKATLAVYHRVVPPTVGCESPHTLLSGDAPALRVLARGEDWPDDGPARAAVSSMGFGGINAHIVLEGTGREATPPPRALLSAHQDAELLLIDGADRAELSARVGQLVRIAAGLSRSDLSDLAAHLALKLGSGALRAAVVASRPAELAERTESLLARRCLDQLGLMRRAGAVAIGATQVESAIRAKPALMLIEASDGAAEGREKLMSLHIGFWGGPPPAVGCFGSAELGVALGRERVIHACLLQERLATAWAADIGRLAGFRAIVPSSWPDSWRSVQWGLGDADGGSRKVRRRAEQRDV